MLVSGNREDRGPYHRNFQLNSSYGNIITSTSKGTERQVQKCVPFRCCDRYWGIQLWGGLLSLTVSKPSVYPSSDDSAAFRPVARQNIKEDRHERGKLSPSTHYLPTASVSREKERKRPGQDNTFRSTMVINSSNQVPLPGPPPQKVHLTKNHQGINLLAKSGLYNLIASPKARLLNTVLGNWAFNPWVTRWGHEGSPDITRIQLGSTRLTRKAYSKHQPWAQEVPGTLRLPNSDSRQLIFFRE